jgi:hypothetical protein
MRAIPSSNRPLRSTRRPAIDAPSHSMKLATNGWPLGRVRRRGCPRPLPSEPYVHLSAPTAPASNNASAWHDRARFHRPTTPLTRRGLPIGLGVNLDGTTTEPVTEDRRRPHLRTLPSETDRLCLPSRLAAGSRPPTPGGSRLAFARGHVATPIRPITGRPSLPPPSSTRRPIGLPYGWPTLAGGRRAYHVASRESSWVRLRSNAGGTSSAPDE